VKTFTYKSVGNLEIKADVHHARDRVLRPVVIWIHGGALIMGHRGGVADRVRYMIMGEGYVLVSIDYRLAPETKLPAIIEDVEDAVSWVQSQGETLFQADSRRIAVMGASAGGYLTLTAGYRVRPRPTVLVSFYGYGHLVADWYSRPSPHPCHHQIVMSREEALRQVSGPPIADARDRNGDGSAFYQHCRQHGLWPQQVTGWDPDTETEKFFPFMPVKNVTGDYPPTMLIHGTADTDVPYEQSVLMTEQFQQYGVPHELVTIEGGEHGLAGGDPERIDAAYASVLTFLKRYLTG
jgi:acetyl esterase/lipase